MSSQNGCIFCTPRLLGNTTLTKEVGQIRIGSSFCAELHWPTNRWASEEVEGSGETDGRSMAGTD